MSAFQMSWTYSPCKDPLCSTLIMHKPDEKVDRYCGLKRCPIPHSYTEKVGAPSVTPPL